MSIRKATPRLLLEEHSKNVSLLRTREKIVFSAVVVTVTFGRGNVFTEPLHRSQIKA